MIRKTAFLVTGTVTGLVAVLSYNPPKLNNAISSAGQAPANGQTPSSTEQTPKSSTKAAPAKSPASKPTSKATTKANSSATTSATKTAVDSQSNQSNASSDTSGQSSSGINGTFQGDTSQTRWGPVQVQVTIANGTITDVSTLQYPNGDRRSMMISSQVIPWLQQEALKVQSANISGVSGASYTSYGFQNSLASALQKAGLSS